VLGNTRSACDADRQTMEYAMQVVTSVEKVFFILEVISELSNISSPLGVIRINFV
jgi:hypothetical protein